MAWIEDKRVVVTGATSGIGREVAGRLASLGADVVLPCRAARRGRHEADDINAATATPRASVMTVDTSDQGSIRTFAQEYQQRYGRLDVLVNNAGVLCPDRRTGVDGIALSGVTGRFFEQGAEVRCELRDEANEHRLWQACEERTRQLDRTG